MVSDEGFRSPHAPEADAAKKGVMRLVRSEKGSRREAIPRKWIYKDEEVSVVPPKGDRRGHRKVELIDQPVRIDRDGYVANAVSHRANTSHEPLR